MAREIQASDAKTRFLSLLSDVERGETIIVTRHGKPIARISPEPAARQEQIARAIKELDDFRQTMPRLTLDEILSARHEGHKY